MNPLIFLQCHLRRPEQLRLLDVCLCLARRLNPEADLLLVDNASPLGLSGLSAAAYGAIAHTYRFPDAIGHFSPKFAGEMENPKDGPGRAIMWALEWAAEQGYRETVYLESDAPYAKPISWGFDRMTKPVACMPRTKWGYLDWQVFWVRDVQWLVNEFGFTRKYDWPNQKQGVGREGERIYEQILGEHLEVLPVKGGRGEGWINAQNLREVFPDGCDSLTHVDSECHAEFLRMNGQEDLAERL